MKNKFLSRRDFLKKFAASAASLQILSCQKLFGREKKGYDAKGVPTRLLGKTGVSIPLIGIGGGSRFCAVKDPEKSVEILSYALDHGFYYWDTGHDYVFENVVSEERYGLVLKERRKEVFLATKIQKRGYDEVMRDLEESLRRLQTDRLDLLQVHNVQSIEDVDKICAQDGALKALVKAREEKITRFIGFTGHRSAEAMMALANRFDFDTMLIALNHYSERIGDFEGDAVPAAAKKKMGVMVIKAIRPREKVESLSAEELIRYALSLPDVSAAVIGTDSLEVLKKNLEIVKNFTPMTLEEMKKIKVGLKPFFEGREIPWMKPGYSDGNPA